MSSYDAGYNIGHALGPIIPLRRSRRACRLLQGEEDVPQLEVAIGVNRARLRLYTEMVGRIRSTRA
jgi:hypothetical protein